MSVDLLQRLSMMSLILAALFFVIAVILFFSFDVPKLFGKITGSEEKKEIDEIRRQNEQSRDKAYWIGHVNVTRGKITEKISPSGQLLRRTSGIDENTNQHKFLTDELNEGSQETTILNAQHDNETTILEYDPNETVILSREQESNKDFSVDIEIGFTDSSEVIE